MAKLATSIFLATTKQRNLVDSPLSDFLTSVMPRTPCWLSTDANLTDDPSESSSPDTAVLAVPATDLALDPALFLVARYAYLAAAVVLEVAAAVAAGALLPAAQSEVVADEVVVALLGVIEAKADAKTGSVGLQGEELSRKNVTDLRANVRHHPSPLHPTPRSPPHPPTKTGSRSRGQI